MKKVISVFLAVIMVFMMNVTAFAVNIGARHSTDIECIEEVKIESIFAPLWDFLDRIIDIIMNIINPTEENPGEGEGEYDDAGNEEDSNSNRKTLRLEKGAEDCLGSDQEFYILPGTLISEKPIPERPGFEFIGWNPEIPEIMPDHDLTCVAQWKRLEGYSTIYFNNPEGGYIFIRGNCLTQEIGSEIEEISYYRRGYVLEGWYPELPSTMPEEDLTVTAIWRKKTDVAVTWRRFDGEEWHEYTDYYDIGDRIEVLEHMVEGPAYYDKLGNPYYFAGWAPDPAEIATENVVYTAQYMG